MLHTLYLDQTTDKSQPHEGTHQRSHAQPALPAAYVVLRGLL